MALLTAGSLELAYRAMEPSRIKAHYELFRQAPVREGYIKASSPEALHDQIKHELPTSMQRVFHGQMREMDKAYMKILLELNPTLHDHLVKGEGFMGEYRELDNDNLFGYSSATR